MPSSHDSSPHTGHWTFLTNHAHVLLCLVEDPEIRLRDVADRVGITERAVSNILRDLEAADIIARTRDGRRNRYTIDGSHALRHPLEAHRRIGELLDLLRRP